MQTSYSSIFETYSPKRSALDTGSPESQIALITQRIKHIAKHVEHNRKDHASILSIIKMAQHRKKLLKYLKNEDTDRYRKICDQLSLKKG